MISNLIQQLFQISLFLILFHASNFEASAQNTLNNNGTQIYKYGIGGGAGFTTGYGLSFKYLPKKFGAQITFAPFKNMETERYSIGLTLIYLLIQNKLTNFYLYQGNHYYYNSQTYFIYDPNKVGEPEKTGSTEAFINNGLGFGFEIIIAKRIGLNLMTGYAFYNNFEQLNVTGEAALYYKF